MHHKPLALMLAPLLGAIAVAGYPASPTIATNFRAEPISSATTSATELRDTETLDIPLATNETLAFINRTEDVPKTAATPIRHVPFFSQFRDIDDAAWRKVACGVASLAMLVEYHKPGSTSANAELKAGIETDAYTENGWSHAGLIALAERHGLSGQSVSLAHLGEAKAFDALVEAVAENPVMVSVHYTFDPQNPIPHLVVVTDIQDGYVHYNDPAEPAGGGFITEEKFLRSWKQRYIAIW